VQEREDEDLAKEFHRQTFIQHGIQPGDLTLHSDRGPAMISRTVATLLTDLGVTKSHSRPHVSDDNPYSESQFKTTSVRLREAYWVTGIFISCISNQYSLVAI
jgi:transposase InsO family protein